jgi:hypothetical protein
MFAGYNMRLLRKVGKFCLIIQSFILLFATNLAAGVITASLTVDWSRTGCPGFSTPEFILNIYDFGAVGDGIKDDAPAVTAAIKAADGPTIIYFPEGKYLMLSAISLKDGITLKGESSQSSFIIFDLGKKAQTCISVSKGQTASFTRVLSGADKGSSSIKIQSPQDFQTNDYIEIRQTNGAWDTKPATWAKYSVGQITGIKNVDGDVLVLDQALRIDYSIELNPEIRIIDPIKNCSIECLNIERSDEPESGAGYNIFFNYAADSRVVGVESNKSVGSHIMINASTNIEVKGCFIHHAFTYDGAGTRGYGVTLNNHAGNCLIENNVFEYLRHAMMTKHGANGNVFAYNYSMSTHRDEVVLKDYSGDISLHGHFSYANLFEGNVVQQIYLDGYWGPSGPYNTFFRNHLQNYGLLITSSDTYMQNIVANDIEKEDFLRGYKVQGANHFEYANRVKSELITAVSEDFADKSYYLNDEPEFWETDEVYPNIGFPYSHSQYGIPAVERSKTGEMTVCPKVTSVEYERPEKFLFDIAVHPNPIQESAIISINLPCSEYIHLELYDIEGRNIGTVYKGELSGGSNKINFTPVNLTTGSYYLVLSSDNQKIACLIFII